MQIPMRSRRLPAPGTRTPRRHPLRVTTRVVVAPAAVGALIGLLGCVAPQAETPRRVFDELVVPIEMAEFDEFDGVDVVMVGDRLAVLDNPLRSDQALRILIPTVYHPPGSVEAQPLPDDFAAYLIDLHGDEVSDVSTIEIDGETARLFTVRVGDEESGFGTLGCLDGTFAADDDAGCYELVFNRTYRMAVTEHDGELVLIWVRTSDRREDPDYFERFDAALATVEFAD